jgi:hypothetical protein
MGNERLHAAMAKVQVDVETMADVAGVDPKTVQRWLGGRLPHPRHRWAVAGLLHEEESFLWPNARPEAGPGSAATAEVVSAWAHRADMPSTQWWEVLTRARKHIDLMGYAFLFLPEQHAELPALVTKKCADGCQVRIMVANPDGAQVRERDALEQLGGTLPARIRMTMQHLRELDGVPGVEMRLHDVHLYNAIYRLDDEMLVTPYLYGLHGFQHPLLHLRRLGPYGIFASFAEQFGRIWADAKPVPESLTATSS